MNWLLRLFFSRLWLAELPRLCDDCGERRATLLLRHLDGTAFLCEACMDRAALGIGA